ncbi:MAG: YHS domain-containing protein, partial [Deltaproteobacteria bacterium]|nr:YHS domain-containing protein [Deltaproteobacteria bacterium]
MKLSVTSKKAVVDPVCGMTVDPCSTELMTEYADKKFYFCADGCRKA